jgi:putative transcriptional regulator
MDEKLFNELLESVQEAGQIIRGDKKASRIFEYSPLDVKKIREKTGLSQDRFARLIGISLRTYQNWEQGHRRPKGPAAALLTIFQHDPQNALKALDK